MLGVLESLGTSLLVMLEGAAEFVNDMVVALATSIMHIIVFYAIIGSLLVDQT